MRTGYFGRASEENHLAKSTKVHIVENDSTPVCGYKPHKTMKFIFCANGVVMRLVECVKCKRIGEKLWEKELAP